MGAAVAETLIQGALEHAYHAGVARVHWLFTTDPATRALPAHGLARAPAASFTGRIQASRDFQDPLDTLIARRRNEIRRGDSVAGYLTAVPAID